MNTNEYYIDGEPLPGGGVVVCRAADVEAGDTGRDESGYLHRWVLRRGLRRWEFRYRELPQKTAAALLSGLPGADTFLLETPEGQALCHLKEVSATCVPTLTAPRQDITITIEEC